jgi:hypothetical protein
VSATPSSTGKDRPGRSAGSGSSPSNGTGLSSGNGGKPSSSGANSTVSSATEPDEVKAETSAAVDGKKDDATTPLGSSAGSPASSGGSPGGSSAKTETKPGGTGTPPLGTPAAQDEQAKDAGLPWRASEASGSAFTHTTGGITGSAKPAPKPFASREAVPGAPSAAPGALSSGPGVSPPGPAAVPPNRSASAGSAFKERVNDVIRPGKGTAGGKSPRKAHLQVSRLEPWSVMKFSFVMSLVCFVVLLVAVAVIYMILSGLGVFDQIVQTINELTQDKNAAKSTTFDAASWFSFTRIFGYTALVGALNVLLITALATVWSVIYNIAADFVGGIEVTLKEAE